MSKDNPRFIECARSLNLHLDQGLNVFFPYMAVAVILYGRHLTWQEELRKIALEVSGNKGYIFEMLNVRDKTDPALYIHDDRDKGNKVYYVHGFSDDNRPYISFNWRRELMYQGIRMIQRIDSIAVHRNMVERAPDWWQVPSPVYVHTK